MGGAPPTSGLGVEDLIGATILCQDVQVWIWNDKDSVLRAYHQQRRSEGGWAKNSSYSGLTGSHNHHPTERVVRAVQLLPKIHTGVFPPGCPTYTTHQKGCIRMEPHRTRDFQDPQEGHVHMPLPDYTRPFCAFHSWVWCIQIGHWSRLDAERVSNCLWTP